MLGASTDAADRRPQHWSMVVVEGFRFRKIPSIVVRSAQISGILGTVDRRVCCDAADLVALGRSGTHRRLCDGHGWLLSCAVHIDGDCVCRRHDPRIPAGDNHSGTDPWPRSQPAWRVDPIHFSVIFLVGASIGFITPPYGLNLYVASGVTGVPYFRLLRYSTMYLVALISVWILVALTPELALWLLPDR